MRARPVAILLAALAFHLAAWGGIQGFRARVSWNPEPLADFTAVYYPMGLAVLEGVREPVQGFYYSPLAALACAPLAALPPQAAAWTWHLLGMLAVVLVVVLPLPLARGAGQRDLYLATALLSFPFLHDLHWGQVSSLLALCAVAALRLHRAGRPAAAGVLLGLAGSIKFFPALLLLPFALRGERRTVLAGLATLVLGLVLVPLAVWGREGLVFHAHVLEAVLSARATLWREAAAAQHVPAVLARWIAGDPAGAPSWPFVVAGALAFAAVGATLVRRRRVAGAEGLLLDVVLLWLALPLVVHPSWPHYFVHLPFAGLVLLRAGGHPAWVVVAGILASAPLLRAVGDPVLAGRLGLLAAADLVLLTGAWRAALARPEGP